MIVTSYKPIFAIIIAALLFQPQKPLEGEKFVDWFSRNRSRLEQESPELSPAELTRHAVRAFRQVQGQAAPATPDAAAKRKREDEASDAPVASAPKQSKLSAFAFQKKT